jgi:uncharacterized protein YecE (DUF72 family)
MAEQLNQNIFVGTSGFAYKEWKGIFYPDDLPQKQYLNYYARQFRTTEINNTFYRMPTATQCANWYAEVPLEFRFTLKLSQRITHFKRLKNVDSEMKFFFESAASLKEKLGPVLVQLPPNFKKDIDVLGQFLETHHKLGMLAFEFRHESWFDDELFELLRRYNAAFSVVEKDEQDNLATPREVTGPFVYMRLRKEEYTDAEMTEWAQWITSRGIPVYCYLKHEDRTPLLARRLLNALASV